MENLSNPQVCDSPSVSVPVPKPSQCPAPAQLPWAFWGAMLPVSPSNPSVFPGKPSLVCPELLKEPSGALGALRALAAAFVVLELPLFGVWRVLGSCEPPG